MATVPRTAPPRWREIVAEGRWPLTLGLVTIELLAGMQYLVVAATMPRVLADLGHVELYGWVFAGYSLAGLAAIPRAGRDADRRGPARPFAEGVAAFIAGGLLSGLAPSMLTLVLFRVIQGYGAAAAYTVAYGVVAKAYPAALRARVIALLTGVWVGSGLVGPSFGAAVATAAGWRWSLLAVIPFAVLALVLALPRLVAIPGGAAGAGPGIRRPLQLTLGSGLLLSGLGASVWWLGLLLAVAGLVVGLPAAISLLPRGTLRAGRGFPALLAIAFTLNVGFFAADSFVPLMLTGVRGLSLLATGVAVTLATLGWSAGNWWQSRVMSDAAAPRLIGWGSVALGASTLAAAGGLWNAMPIAAVFAAWTIAGVAMGIAYSTTFVAVMDGGVAGAEGEAVAARMVTGRLGMALGPGLGGAAVAASAATGAGLRPGLAGVFAVAALACGLAAWMAPRVRPASLEARPSS